MELLTVEQMARADRAAADFGMSGKALMWRAGMGVALCVARSWRPCRVLVACGPGNNGGDGFVAAHMLRQWQWPKVDVTLLMPQVALQGDALWAKGLWQEPCLDWGDVNLAGYDLVIDAALGAGLRKPLTGALAAYVRALNASGLPVCAVDMPTGVCGNSGQIAGCAVQAEATVSFFRKKPGHLLYPGRACAGRLHLVDIGIPADVLPALHVQAWENLPALWLPASPQADERHHKYQRGMVSVLGGAELTGAAMLAACAAQKAGAGLVEIAAPAQSHGIYAQAMQSVMVRPTADDAMQALRTHIYEGKANAWVVGPGAGVGEKVAASVRWVLDAGKKLVMDADAITAFEASREDLFAAIAQAKIRYGIKTGAAAGDVPVVLTPHEGEFARLFGREQLQGHSKLECARQAASQSGAVVVLKGADTVVAAPGGRAVINACAPSYLATGGSGDVLAGVIGALLAAGWPAFEAAAAGVWLHSQAAQVAGQGLTPENLVAALPSACALLFGHWSGAG